MFVWCKFDKFCPRVCVHSRCLSQMSHSARGNKQYNVLVSERPRISNGTLFHFYSPLCRKYRCHLWRKPVCLFSWYCILFIIKGAFWDLLIGPLINQLSGLLQIDGLCIMPVFLEDPVPLKWNSPIQSTITPKPTTNKERCLVNDCFWS